MLDGDVPAGHVSVAALSVTAIKGFRLADTAELRLTPTGIPGNREFFFADETGTSFSVTQSPCFLRYWSRWDSDTNEIEIGDATGTVLHGQVRARPAARFRVDERAVVGRPVPGPWDDFASDLAGRRLQLVRAPGAGGAYDYAPLTVQTTASVRSLGDEADGTSMSHLRFRMNITLGGCDVANVEESWAGRIGRIGTAVVRFGGPVPRCVAVDYHPETCSRDSSVRVLKRINEVRGVQESTSGKVLVHGVYADVLESGSVRVGDALRFAADVPT